MPGDERREQQHGDGAHQDDRALAQTPDHGL
jgi:hypothetical protein